MWRRDDRDMFRYDALRIVGAFACLAVLALLSFVAVSWLDHREPGLVLDDRSGDPAYGLLVFAVFWALLLIVNGVWWSVSFVRGRRRRPHTIEGTVVLRELVAVPGDAGTVHLHYLAVDDGTADTVAAFLVQPEVYAHRTVGDVVRVLRDGGTGRFMPVEK